MAGTAVQHRRGTAAQWAAANPVLPDGELGYEKDTGIVKVGNGTSTWNQLPPILGSSYLPVLGKAADSERLDGLDSSAFFMAADAETEQDRVNDLILPSGVNRVLRVHHGTGDAFPTEGVKSGDTFRSLQKATFIYVPELNPAWRQIDGPLTVPSAAERDEISTERPYQLHPGFQVQQTDTREIWTWTGSAWEGGWTAYSVVWSSAGAAKPTLGNGTLIGRYRRQGKTVEVFIQLALGSTTNGGQGIFNFTLPVAGSSQFTEQPLLVKAYVPNLGMNFVGFAPIGMGASSFSAFMPYSNNNVNMQPARNTDNTGTTGTGWPFVSNGFPFTSGANLFISGRYEVT